jgi:hypothetical protein
MAESQGINVKQAITDELVLAEIANNCKLAEVTNEPTERLVTTNKLIGSRRAEERGQQFRPTPY